MLQVEKNNPIYCKVQSNRPCPFNVCIDCISIGISMMKLMKPPSPFIKVQCKTFLLSRENEKNKPSLGSFFNKKLMLLSFEDFAR